MFTGIIETVGRVASLEARRGGARLGVEAAGIAPEVALGASIAVNGACISVVGVEGSCVFFDVVQETLDRTALGDLSAGSRVNLERALAAHGRLDGHLVQGHVDATGRVRAVERAGDDVRLVVDCEPEFAEALVEKGSIAVDGVSLTLAAVEGSGFEVALIPHTLHATTLGERKEGERVNLEADIIGKYVKRHLERMFPAPGPGRD